MTKYISFNNDGYLQLPTLTFHKVVIDAVIKTSASNTYIMDTRTGVNNGYVILKPDGTLIIAGGSMSATPNPPTLGTRGTLALEGVNASYFTEPNLEGTDDITVFANNTGGSSLKGDLYAVTVYDGLGNVVAHYDMSTGTVQDQSGNGNDATLNGGTWLDDGSGGTTGTPVTYTYDTKQSIYANVNLSADTKQSIYANRVAQFDTKQAIYKPINQPYDTKQAIYKAIQELFDTEQVFTQAYTQVSYTYDMKIQQYNDIQESVDTKQAYYTDISVDLDTKQVIYKQIQNLYDTLIQIRNTHDETLYGTLTIQRVIEHRLTINKRHSEDLKIERVLNHILRV